MQKLYSLWQNKTRRSPWWKPCIINSKNQNKVEEEHSIIIPKYNLNKICDEFKVHVQLTSDQNNCGFNPEMLSDNNAKRSFL